MERILQIMEKRKHMKKYRLIAAVCTATLFLSGCQSSTAMLAGYSEINLLKSNDAQDVLPPSVGNTFSQNIAVISGDGLHGDVSATNNSVTVESEAQIETEPETQGTVAEDGTVIEPQEPVPAESEPVVEEPEDLPSLLIDRSSGEAVYWNKAFQEIAPASLTKLMTALVALKYGTLSDVVTLTPEMNYNITWDSQTCGFMAGDQVTLETLLQSMIVYSGNEAANAIAIHIGGSIENFLKMMNEEALKIGATNTNFVNTNGLDMSGHYSSVYDLYLIFNECMKYDTFVNAMESSNIRISYTGAAGVEKTTDFITTNYYMKSMAESPDGMTVYGGKTGTTDSAGACLICYVLDDAGNDYIAVSMGNEDKTKLYAQMNKILTKILN